MAKKMTVKQAANIVAALHVVHRANEMGVDVTPELTKSVLSELAGTHGLPAVRQAAKRGSVSAVNTHAKKNHNNDSTKYRNIV